MLIIFYLILFIPDNNNPILNTIYFIARGADGVGSVGRNAWKISAADDFLRCIIRICSTEGGSVRTGVAEALCELFGTGLCCALKGSISLERGGHVAVSSIGAYELA